jgi:hypothetical protein
MFRARYLRSTPAMNTSWCALSARLLALLILFPVASQAQVITQSNPTSQGSDAATGLTCGPPTVFLHEIITDDSGLSCEFSSTQKMLLGADSRVAGFDNDVSKNLNHRINFHVDSEGRPWTVHVHQERHGFLKTREDGGNCAEASLSRITANITGAAISTTGNFGTSADYVATGCTDHVTTVNDVIDGTISGTGNGFVTIDLTSVARAYSDASFLIGGIEAVVALGISDAADCGGGVKIVAADYTPGSNYGHTVTVSMEGSNAATLNVIVNPAPNDPEVCRPTNAPGPCTWIASGKITGCVKNNYDVSLQYFDVDNGALMCSDTVHITNGSKSWYSEVTCNGPCLDPVYSWQIGAQDVPGLTAQDVPGLTQGQNGYDQLVASNQLDPILTGTLTAGESCVPVHRTPALPNIGVIILSVLLSLAGMVLIWRRRITIMR